MTTMSAEEDVNAGPGPHEASAEVPQPMRGGGKARRASLVLSEAQASLADAKLVQQGADDLLEHMEALLSASKALSSMTSTHISRPASEDDAADASKSSEGPKPQPSQKGPGPQPVVSTSRRRGSVVSFASREAVRDQPKEQQEEHKPVSRTLSCSNVCLGMPMGVLGAKPLIVDGEQRENSSPQLPMGPFGAFRSTSLRRKSLDPGSAQFYLPTDGNRPRTAAETCRAAASGTVSTKAVASEGHPMVKRAMSFTAGRRPAGLVGLGAGAPAGGAAEQQQPASVPFSEYVKTLQGPTGAAGGSAGAVSASGPNSASSSSCLGPPPTLSKAASRRSSVLFAPPMPEEDEVDAQQVLEAELAMQRPGSRASSQSQAGARPAPARRHSMFITPPAHSTVGISSLSSHGTPTGDGAERPATASGSVAGAGAGSKGSSGGGATCASASAIAPHPPPSRSKSSACLRRASVILPGEAPALTVSIDTAGPLSPGATTSPGGACPTLSPGSGSKPLLPTSSLRAASGSLAGTNSPSTSLSQLHLPGLTSRTASFTAPAAVSPLGALSGGPIPGPPLSARSGLGAAPKV